jgi:hypothetical protein
MVVGSRLAPGVVKLEEKKEGVGGLYHRQDQFNGRMQARTRRILIHVSTRALEISLKISLNRSFLAVLVVLGDHLNRLKSEFATAVHSL